MSAETSTTSTGMVHKTPKQKVDLYRDTPVRYLGYANEVGESFRYILPGFVKWSYAISFGYCAADSFDKSSKLYLSYDKPECPIRFTPQNKRVWATATDVLVWQSFASVLIPGLVINRVVAMTKFLKASFKFTPVIHKWLPTAVGLLSIPFIVKPIDHGVDYAMNNTLRSHVEQFKEFHK